MLDKNHEIKIKEMLKCTNLLIFNKSEILIFYFQITLNSIVRNFYIHNVLFYKQNVCGEFTNLNVAMKFVHCEENIQNLSY